MSKHSQKFHAKDKQIKYFWLVIEGSVHKGDIRNFEKLVFETADINVSNRNQK